MGGGENNRDGRDGRCERNCGFGQWVTSIIFISSFLLCARLFSSS